nr:hypothetical protein [Tanacetum cinerariifolium]
LAGDGRPGASAPPAGTGALRGDAAGRHYLGPQVPSQWRAAAARHFYAHRAAVLGRPAQVPATVWLAEAPAESALGPLTSAGRPEWPGLPWRVQPAAGSLGERMAHAFAEAFAAG